MKTRPDNDRTARDIALFDEIAGQYIRKDLYPPSRKARKLRLMQTVRSIDRNTGALDILEVGCGAGFSANYLKGFYRTFTGIDYSEKLIELAGLTHQIENVSFETADLFEYPAEKQFDIIIMIGVLHHMPDMEGALSKCFQLLKPGGFIIANEPQPANPIIHMLRKIRAIVDDSYSEEQEELSRGFLLQLFRDAKLEHVGSKSQGVFSTPFAEVVIKPRFIIAFISSLCCWLDRILEQYANRLIRGLSWNIIVFGKKPE